ASSYQHGVVLQHNTAKGGYRAFVVGDKPGDEARRGAFQKILAELPPKDAPITASERLVPHLSNRNNTYTLRIGVYNATHILLDQSALLPGEEKKLKAALAKRPWGLAARHPPFLLLERGGDPETLRPHLGNLLPQE